jgi:agmatinase
LTLILGGDHYVTYPAFEGVIQAWRERQENVRIGHLHVDSHTDFFDDLHMLGRYNHGTCARRISEIPEVKRMAWFGLNGASILEPKQLDLMHEKQYQCYTTSYIERVGVEQAMKETLEYLMDGIDLLYVTLDIDVLNGSVAPATHSPVFEGLSGHQFLQVARALAKIENIVGLDVCEVAPPIAPTGPTERLAALAVMTVMGGRISKVIGKADEKKWDAVVRV